MARQAVEGLQPESSGIIAGFQVMAARSGLCMEKLTQLLEERMDWMQARQDVRRLTTRLLQCPAKKCQLVLRCWEWEMMRTKSNERYIGDRE